MRNRLIAGLFTTAVLLFATPVAAAEIDNISQTSRIEEIQGMIQRSRERQGSVQAGQKAESEPIAPTSDQTTVISALTETPSLVSTVTRQSQIAPFKATKSSVLATTLESAQSTFQSSAKSTFYNSKTQSTLPATNPLPATTSANTAQSAEPELQNPRQTNVSPQSSQQVAVRHANRHRHQSASDEPPPVNSTNFITQKEPNRDQQLSHKGFMLFAADLAWDRVDNKHDYALGARLERGVISPLAAIRVYAPNRLSEALGILAGEKEYT